MNLTRLFTPRVIVLDQAPLSEAELAGAFAVALSDLKMRALLQVIGDIEREAANGAQKTVANHGICASQNGAAEAMGLLRDRILMLQAKGFGQLKQTA